MGANERQVGGDHYKKRRIQPWDYIADNELGYFEGNIVKYVTRYSDKGGIDDLRKAKHYLEKLIEVVNDNTQTKKGSITETKRTTASYQRHIDSQKGKD